MSGIMKEKPKTTSRTVPKVILVLMRLLVEKERDIICPPPKQRPG